MPQKHYAYFACLLYALHRLPFSLVHLVLPHLSNPTINWALWNTHGVIASEKNLQEKLQHMAVTSFWISILQGMMNSSSSSLLLQWSTWTLYPPGQLTLDTYLPNLCSGQRELCTPWSDTRHLFDTWEKNKRARIQHFFTRDWISFRQELIFSSILKAQSSPLMQTLCLLLFIIFWGRNR
jgi:hypothetical protein